MDEKIEKNVRQFQKKINQARTEHDKTPLGQAEARIREQRQEIMTANNKISILQEELSKAAEELGAARSRAQRFQDLYAMTKSGLNKAKAAIDEAMRGIV